MTTFDPRAMRRAVVSVGAVFFAHGVLFASWAAHIPHVKARIGVDDAGLGVALLGAPIGSVSAIGLMAYLVPRVGSRLMVQIALVGYCASGPLVGLIGSPVGLFAALVVWGAFQGGLDIAMNTQAITVEKAKGRPIMNRMHAWWGLGAFAGAGAGTAGVALDVSLAVQLSALGAVTLVAAGVTTAAMLPDPPHEPEPGERRRRIRPSTPMIVLGLIAFASMMCEGAAADWSSLYLRNSLGAAASIGGIGYTVFSLAMVLVRSLGDRVIERWSARVVIPTLAATAAMGFGVALAVGAVALSVFGFFLLGIGLGAVVPSAFGAAGRLPGVHPGVGVAAVSGLGWAGFVFGPPMIGALSGATSLPLALGLVPVLIAFIAIATRRVPGLQPTITFADA